MEDTNATILRDSDTSSDSEPDDDEVVEGMGNPFSKWKTIKVAVSSDEPVWLGIQAERETGKGGAKYKIGVPSAIGVGIKRVEKEHHLVSRIPWVKAKGHK